MEFEILNQAFTAVPQILGTVLFVIFVVLLLGCLAAGAQTKTHR